MVANVSLVVAMLDRQWQWKALGVVAAIVVCLLSQSRLALVALLLVPMLMWFMARVTRPLIWVGGAIATTLAGILASPIMNFLAESQARFSAARAASSRVRSALGRIAVERWSNEAPWFRPWHRGAWIALGGIHANRLAPHLVWPAFRQGRVDLLPLAVPMAASFLELLLKAQTSRTARAALAMLLILFFYTFGENLEILVYLFWPGLLLIGKVFLPRACAARSGSILAPKQPS